METKKLIQVLFVLPALALAYWVGYMLHGGLDDYEVLRYFISVLAGASAGVFFYLLVIILMEIRYVKIAFRNISRQKKRTFIVGGAIAFGMMMITGVNSFTAGASEAINLNISEVLDGHILIGGQKKLESGKVVNNLFEMDKIFDILDESGIEFKKIHKRSQTSMTLIYNDSSYQAFSVLGMDWESEKEVLKGMTLAEGEIENVYEENAIVLSKKAAEKLDVHVGDMIIAKMSTVTGQVNVGDFKVAGVLKGEDLLSSYTMYCDIRYMNLLTGVGENDYQTIYLSLESLDDVEGVADTLYEALDKEFQMMDRDQRQMGGGGGGRAFKRQEDEWEGKRLTLFTVKELLSGLDGMYTAINTATFIILIVFLLIIVVGLVNTFRMIMYDRIKEIGSMRAMGVQRDGIRGIFLWEGFILALGAIVAGVFLAVLLMVLLSLKDFGSDHAMAFFLRKGHIYFNASWIKFLLNIGFISFMTLLAVLLPASKAAKLDPAKAIASMY